MKEQLLAQAAAVMNAIGSAIKSGVELASQGVQELAHQIVLYGIVVHGLYTVGGLLLVAIAVFLYKKSTKEFGKEADLRCDDCAWVNVIGAVIFVIAGGFTLIVNVKTLLVAIFAPYIYIIQFVTDFAQQVK